MSRQFRAKAMACICMALSIRAGVSHAEVPSSLATDAANGTNAQQVRSGMLLYKTYCAQCHGRNLQGQPLWHVQDADHNRRAPAQDDTGHTWQHSDKDLVEMIRLGKFPGTPPSTASYMPAFSELLRDQQIFEVLAFIKARWAIGLRASQASLNPSFVGMPENSENTPWTLPPNCNNGALQEWLKGPR